MRILVGNIENTGFAIGVGGATTLLLLKIPVQGLLSVQIVVESICLTLKGANNIKSPYKQP